MRAKIISIAHDDLVNKLGLPEDCVISDISRDLHTQDIIIVVHSQSFLKVENHHQIRIHHEA